MKRPLDLVRRAAELLQAGRHTQARAIMRYLLRPRLDVLQYRRVRTALSYLDEGLPGSALSMLESLLDGSRLYFSCSLCHREYHDMYMVHDEVWHAAGPARHDHAHLACLAARLGRPLTPADFTDAPINDTVRAVFAFKEIQ